MKRIKIGNNFFPVQVEVLREQLGKLIKVKVAQCPKRKVDYVTTEFRDGQMQTWIVMNGIELSYMIYQGRYASIFMCSRCSDKHGDVTFYFRTYKKCLKVWDANKEELNAYIESIAL